MTDTTTPTDVILARHLRVGDVIPGVDATVEAIGYGAENAKVYVWPLDGGHALAWDLDDPVRVIRPCPDCGATPWAGIRCHGDGHLR